MIIKKKQIFVLGLIVLLTISYVLPFIYDTKTNPSDKVIENKDPLSSAQRSVTKQWIKNPTFDSPIEPTWYWENGTEGDNSDMDASTSPDQANYEVLGETRTFTVVSGVINSSTSTGWKEFRNGDFQFPSIYHEIRSYGCYVSHQWADDTNQAPSVHWKTNISIPIDMSDYIITSASLEVIVNASVSSNVDTPNDTGDWDFFAIGDSVTFYSQISDLDYNPPLFTVASNKTKYLGQQNSTQDTILTIDDGPLEPVGEIDLITALNSAFNKDPSHSNFTLTLGIDIYSEDNFPGVDTDTFDDLIIKTCNLTFTVKKKIDQSTTISWNQEGNTLDSANIQVTDAKFFFKYKINNTWPSSAPLSEIKFYINDKSYDEGIIKLSSATTSWQEAKVGGFDVTSLISTDVNITVTIEVFLKDTFELDQTYSISIDDVYLNISYIETFPDYGTDLELILDGEDKTLDPVIQIPIKDMLNITVTYKDNVSGNHISADSATLEGKVSGDLTENDILEQYYFIVNSTEIGLGISVLTVTLQKINYETESIQIFIEVIERETELQLLVEDTPRSNKETIDVKFNEFLNFTVFYEDNLTNTFIDIASVELLGFGSMNETSNQYNFTLNTNDLSQGVNILTIFAQKNNSQSQTIQFFINVQIRSTYIEFYVEGLERNDGDTINSQFDVILNITVMYRDNNTDSHLNGADVDLLGLGSFDEIGTQFNYSVQTNLLSKGINILTVFFQLDGYQAQTIQFFINVNERATELTLFINGIQKNQSDTIQFEVNEVINITVFYKDYLTGVHLNGANAELLGINNLDELGSQFNITINSNDLEQGINILTIFAQLLNYQPKSIQFFIEVVERATQIQLFLNGIDKTADPVLEVPIGTLINITLKFYDNRTGLEIHSAVLQLIGESLYENLTENLILNQYSIILDSSNLLLGIKLFTIVAQAPTYQINTIDIRITVKRVSTSINTVSNLIYVSIDQNDDFFIQIVLNNTDFGGTIKNATVTYRWDNRQGVLTDSNNDGIYEATLYNVPAGSYRISINAYAGDDYDFRDDFEIVLNTIAPPGLDLTMILIILAAGVIGISVGFVLYQKHYKYPPKVRMMRKLRKKISKGKNLKPLEVNTRDSIITSETESNREMLNIEKEKMDKLYKKTGGDSLE